MKLERNKRWAGYELTSAGGKAEKTLNYFTVDEAVVDGENMDLGIRGGDAI